MSLLIHEHRRHLKQLRSHLDVVFQAKVGLAIYNRLLLIPLFQQATHVACYLPQKGEVPTSPIIEYLWQQQKYCYLPVLSPTLPKTLTFHPYQPTTSLRANRYGILEPTTSSSIAIEALDVVIVPLVGFDAKCHRIGMGVGYYDRTFACRKINNLPVLIGIAYDMQKIDNFEPEVWDIPMDIVVTETTTYP